MSIEKLPKEQSVFLRAAHPRGKSEKNSVRIRSLDILTLSVQECSRFNELHIFSVARLDCFEPLRMYIAGNAL